MLLRTRWGRFRVGMTTVTSAARVLGSVIVFLLVAG
jgi:hypothetical protein